MKKILGLFISMISMLLLTFSVILSSNASDGDTASTTDSSYYEVKYYEEVGNYRNNPEQMEGYLFAGWFKEESCAASTYLKSSDTTGPAYAKYVPEEILGLKVQVTKTLWDDNTTNDSTGAIRFVTSVDSLDYSQVGFIINIGGADNYKANKYVYKQLYGEIGSGNKTKVDTYVPSKMFHSESEFFKTFTVQKISELKYLTTFKITPYWVTLDGNTVKGETEEVTVNQLRQWDYVFVDDSGEATVTDDEGNPSVTPALGTRNYPYKTLEDALKAMDDNMTFQKNAGDKGIVEYYSTADTDGKVYILNKLTADSNFTWNSHKLDVSIQGDKAEKEGVFDLSAISTLNIGDGVTFENMTLTLPTTVYAWGNRVKVADSVKVTNTNEVTLYGGGNGDDGDTTDDDSVKSTDITLLTGTYKAVYGGGNAANVTGSTKVYIGGNVNEGIDHTEHDSSKSYSLYGGSLNGNINGGTKITVEGKALFTHIFGGGKGAGTTVNGQSEVYFKGNAKAMSIYGGSQFGKNNASTLVKMEGNTWVEQVFGGCQANTVKGNTNVQILGGTVNRRIYGGCYNNFNESSTSWDTSHGVTGKTNVTIGKDADLAFEYTKTVLVVSKKSDNSLYATSRYSAPIAEEIGILIFTDYSTNDEREDKIGYVDEWGFSSYFSTTPYHYLVKTSGDGNVSVSDDGSVLRIKPGEGMEATVTIYTGEEGKETHYTTENSTYQLPNITSTTEQHKVEIKFSAKSDNKDVSGYDARIGSAYYSTLEAAVNSVNTVDATTITVLDDIDVTNTITIPAGSNVTIKDDGIARSLNRGSSLTAGTMIQLGSKATLTLESSGDINDCKLILDGQNVTTTGNSPLIQLPSSANATLNINAGVKLQNNKSGNDSGVVHVDGSGGIVHVDGAYFANNVAGNRGGALRLWSGEGHTVENAKFENNKAANGGAIFTGSAKVTCTIENTEFVNNEATTSGGAIYITEYKDSEFTITDCKFTGNKAVVSGGAINARANGVVVKLVGNSADKAIFSGNEAREGGAVAVGANSKLTVDGYEFTGNKAIVTQEKDATGGAIWLNTATATITDTTFSENTSANYGGAIYAKKGSTLTLEATTGSTTAKFEGNTATTGSAIYLVGEDGYTTTLNGSGYTFVAEDNNTIVLGDYATNNFVPNVKSFEELKDALTAIENSAIKTGNIRLAADITVTEIITIPAECNVTIEDDGSGTARSLNRGSSLTAGAMIQLGSKATLTLESSGDINNCKLILDGQNVTTTGNSPLIQLPSSANATLNINAGVKLQNNKSGNHSGVVHVDGSGGIVHVDGAYFANNVATSQGGALRLWSGEGHTVENAKFENNKAANGGAIFTGSAKVTCTIENTEFVNNEATTSGGAIYITEYKDSEFTITDCKFTGNKAVVSGGAINARSNGVVVKLVGNSADKAIFSGNEAREGGAVAVGASSKLTVNGYEFTGNKAIVTQEKDATGGAIWLNTATATITDTTFSENTSANYGGAIYAKKGSTLTLEATTDSTTAKFEGNTATTGTAIYLVGEDGYTTTLNGSGYTFVAEDNNTIVLGDYTTNSYKNEE